MQSIAVCCIIRTTFRRTFSSVCCRVLQYAAECCSVMQSVAEYCSVLHHAVPPFEGHSRRYVVVCCSVLQCVAACCRVLQRVAVCCSVLHHTVPPSKDILISDFKPQILKSSSVRRRCANTLYTSIHLTSYVYIDHTLYPRRTFQHPDSCG